MIADDDDDDDDDDASNDGKNGDDDASDYGKKESSITRVKLSNYDLGNIINCFPGDPE